MWTDPTVQRHRIGKLHGVFCSSAASRQVRSPQRRQDLHRVQQGHERLTSSFVARVLPVVTAALATIVAEEPATWLRGLGASSLVASWPTGLSAVASHALVLRLPAVRMALLKLAGLRTTSLRPIVPRLVGLTGVALSIAAANDASPSLVVLELSGKTRRKRS